MGLPQFDRTSWDKGFADGFRGHVWWPGPGTEPLSYSSGYTEAQAERDATVEPQIATASAGHQPVCRDAAKSYISSGSISRSHTISSPSGDSFASPAAS